jgi:hypothetical protein
LVRATLHLNRKAAACNLRRLCYLMEASFSAFCRPQSVRTVKKGGFGQQNGQEMAEMGTDPLFMRLFFQPRRSDGQ